MDREAAYTRAAEKHFADHTDPMPTPEEAMSWVPLWTLVAAVCAVLAAVLFLPENGWARMVHLLSL